LAFARHRARRGVRLDRRARDASTRDARSMRLGVRHMVLRASSFVVIVRFVWM